LACWLALVAGALSSSVRAASVAAVSNIVAQAPEAGTQEEFINALGLKEIQVGALRVFYGPPLANDLNAVRETFEKLSIEVEEEQKRAGELLGKSDEIIREINRLVGWEPDAEFLKYQRELFSALLNNATWRALLHDSRLFFMPKAETKRYLRGGGRIPGMTYDPVTDTANSQFTQGVSSTNLAGPSERAGLLAFPGDSLAEVSGRLNSMRETFSTVSAGAVLHEVVEITLLKRLAPSDQYYRWFSDGFANAMTELLLRRFVSVEAERKMAEAFSIARYQDLKSSILLRYWPGEARRFDTFLESERRLGQARYSFATVEARRLIEKHGPEVLKRTLDLALTDTRKIEGGYTTSDRLLHCLQRVTGEDLEARFREYQPFRTLDEGLAQFEAALKTADAQSNHLSAFTAILRLMELQPAKTGQLPFNLYAEAADRLYETGRSEEAAGAIADKLIQQISAQKLMGNAETVRQLQQILVHLALSVEKLSLAEAASRDLLAADPNDVAGLSWRLEMLSSAGRDVEAKQLAEQIIQQASAADSSFLARAQFKLGMFYAQGSGVMKDQKQARDWLERSATNGLPAAARVLGWLFLGNEDGPREPIKAVAWLNRAADKGDVEAHRVLGVLYLEGAGVERDERKGFEHTAVAADKGDISAQANLAKLYYVGRGTPRDFDLAFRWARKAAERGEASAQHLIGAMYARGEGVQKDLVEAYKWMSLAAEAGIVDATELRTGIVGDMTAAQLAQGIRELPQLKARLRFGPSKPPATKFDTTLDLNRGN
jgi:TPR repeat protein